MKEGWEYKKLGEVCRIERGGSPRPIKDFITNSPEGLNWIKIGDTDPQGKYIYSTKEKIKPEGLRKSRWVEVDEFLLSNSMSFGRPYILKTNGCIHDGWLVLRDYQNSLIIDYFYYLLISPHVQNQFRTKAQGSTVSNLNTDRVADVNIAFPPLSEQQSIVDYLDSAFAKIDAMKANAEKALNEAKALFQASLKEMLEPKEGWKEKTLGDICEIKSILVDPTEVQYKNLLHVGGANIVSETGELIDLKTAAEEELTSGKFTFDDNDVLYNKIRPYLIKVSRPDFSGLCSADMYPLTSKKGMTRDYLYYILVSRDFTDYAIMNSARAGMPKLNRQSLFAYKCMIPPLSEQQSIVATLDSLKSKVDRLQANYDKISQECDALKQAILRQVFE